MKNNFNNPGLINPADQAFGHNLPFQQPAPGGPLPDYGSVGNNTPGSPGSVWYEGAGVPANGLGIDGDFYLNTSNGNVYRKASGIWGLPIANLTGPAGAPGTPGIPGTPGTPGTPGSVWYEGANAPGGGLGIVGDFYLDTSTGDVYQKTGGGWGSPIANLTGPAGAPGTPGIPGIPGTPGTPGSVWYEGTNAPGGGLGIVGDFYLDTSTGDVYQKTGGGWGSPIANLTGPAGAPGSPGSVWYEGANAPGGGLGIVGDFYLDTSTGDVYQKTGGGWGSPIANITGPVGPAGPPSTGFIVAYEKDLSALPDQIITSGANVIDNHTWQADNVANASGFGIVHNTGLVITAINGQCGGNLRNSPMIAIPLTSFAPELTNSGTSEIWIWARITSGASHPWSLVGIESNPWDPMLCTRLRAGVGFTGSQRMEARLDTGDNNIAGETTQSIATNDDVVVIRMRGSGGFEAYSGSWQNGFPARSSLTLCGVFEYYNSPSGWGESWRTGFSAKAIGMFLAAEYDLTGSATQATIKAIRVEYAPSGNNVSSGGAGSVWYEGAGGPGSGLGSVGDFYLDGNTGNVYTKTILGWGSPVCNIKGPSGGGGTRPAYNTCAIYWDLPSGPPYDNLGTAGALPLSVYSDAQVVQRNGVYGLTAGLKALSSDSKGFLGTGNTTAGESNSISVFCWFKLIRRSDWSIILAKYYGLNNTGIFAWALRFPTTNQFYLEIATGGITQPGVGSTPLDAIPFNIWTHIGFTYDSTTGALTLYKDGLAIASETLPIANLDYGTHGSYVVGADYQYITPPRDCECLIEDIRIDPSVYSAATVASLFAAADLRE